MEDDHVDRPGVEVRQRMKLTGTNSSIGLIIHIAHTHPTLCPHGSPLRGRLLEGAGWPAARSRVLGLRPGSRRRRRREQKRGKTRCNKDVRHILPYSPTPLKTQLLIIHAFCRPGGSGGVAAPVPIPNTAVKRPSADGTSS